jgi:hypothetical protein
LDLLCECEVNEYTQFTPRYFVEKLNIKNWNEVEKLIKEIGNQPWWFDYVDTLEKGKNKFNELLNKL